MGKTDSTALNPDFSRIRHDVKSVFYSIVNLYHLSHKNHNFKPECDIQLENAEKQLLAILNSLEEPTNGSQ